MPTDRTSTLIIDITVTGIIDIGGELVTGLRNESLYSVAMHLRSSGMSALGH